MWSVSRFAKLAVLPSQAGRLMLEAVAVFSQDYRNIQRGMYKAPYDMDPAHRQFNPAYILDKSQRFISEVTRSVPRHNCTTDTTAQQAQLARTCSGWKGCVAGPDVGLFLVEKIRAGGGGCSCVFPLEPKVCAE